jgi:transposase
MPNHVRILTVPDADRAELQRRVKDRGAPARVAERARIVLLSAEGKTGPQIAAAVGCTEPTVVKWRGQYAGDGLAGLEDALRGGGPVTVLTEETVHQILAATLTPPPQSLQKEGVTHWSARRLADWLARSKKLRVSHDSIARVWRRFGLAPHRTEGFKFSTDPHLEAKIRDVVGLYLNPPENAVVLSVDEKSQCQALERSQPILPLRPGIPERQAQRVRPARHHQLVRRAQHRHRAGHRHLLPQAPAPGVPQVPQEGRRRLPGHRAARGPGQLQHAQARQGQGVAGEEPPDHSPLHPDLLLLAQPGRAT